MAEKTLIIKLYIKDPDAAACFQNALASVPGFSVVTNGVPCDVMVMEIGHDLDQELMRLEQIRAKGLAREFFLTSACRDPDVLLRAWKTGAREFFPHPLDSAEVVAALGKLKRSVAAGDDGTGAKQCGRLVGVIGSKGGVGATTVAVNLSVALRETDAKTSVLLMDMNPLLGDVHLFLDVKTSFSWADGARDIARMDSTYLLNTLYKHPSGIHVLPAPAKPLGIGAATPETMARLMDVIRSTFDVVVMDGCSAFDDLSIAMLGQSDTILVISELNLPALVNAKKLMGALEGLGLAHGKDIRFVINRYQRTSLVTPEEAERTVGKNIVTLIPNDYEATMSAINNGKTLSDVALQSEMMDRFKELAALLLHRESVRKEKSPFSFIRKNIRELTAVVQGLRQKQGAGSGEDAR
jgi:pilus assembly protein CpaE